MIASCKAGMEADRLLYTLCEEDVVLEGLSLHYRFCRFDFAAPQYYAEVTLGTQCSAAYLGEARERALHLYHLLVREGVTPCTLRDIVRDMRLETEFF